MLLLLRAPIPFTQRPVSPSRRLNLPAELIRFIRPSCLSFPLQKRKGCLMSWSFCFTFSSCTSFSFPFKGWGRIMKELSLSRERYNTILKERDFFTSTRTNPSLLYPNHRIDSLYSLQKKKISSSRKWEKGNFKEG